MNEKSLNAWEKIKKHPGESIISGVLLYSLIKLIFKLILPPQTPADS